jgi:hypothetical protein
VYCGYITVTARAVGRWRRIASTCCIDKSNGKVDTDLAACLAALQCPQE